ncbi:glycyl-radical enzyme activating protein [Thomasclavelia sp.]|uniref:glycyl-radical enzyme activating protein n=1 Tax=Thomasclavelia sp. TaxID=3025757 RepID=UPI0025EF7E6D|nr:glycyl-radical enzyme activating protein [Thomasclavelia sp.]
MKTSKALIFDIKRFAVHDGDGLRTTVFFKGCPLRCLWCQNPEGIEAKRKVVYFKNRCIHCRRCIKFANIDQMEYKNNRPYFNHQYLGDFDNLINACPTNAISYDSIEYDIDTLMEKIKADQVFFQDTGGVTFSGGEPLMQGEFLLEILKRCKIENIHCAIETSLYAPIELIKKILPYLDLIYIDLKIFDETKHQQLTNVSSKLIKKQIKYILQSKHKDKVIIRTPLIPTMTAFDDNIKAIASFLVDLYPNVKYELLNYNPLASSKYELVDFEYGVDKKYKMFDENKMQHFYDLVYQTGLKNLIIE